MVKAIDMIEGVDVVVSFRSTQDSDIVVEVVKWKLSYYVNRL